MGDVKLNIYQKKAIMLFGYLDLRFKREYKFDERDRAAQELVWAEQLAKFDVNLLSEENCRKALDLWAEVNGTGYAPTIDQFISCLKKITYVEAPRLTNLIKQDDYLGIWNQCDDKGKFRFFIDHPFAKVPPNVRLLFTQYNEKHRGWSRLESKMMIKFHGLPFQGAGQGAIINNQREILDYFVKRKAA